MTRPWLIRVYEKDDGPLHDNLAFWVAVAGSSEDALAAVIGTMTDEERGAIYEIDVLINEELPVAAVQRLG